MPNRNEPEIAALVELSARVGCDPLLAQAGSGNTSIKIGDVLWIKASGKWLACAKQEDILVPLDLAEVRICLRQNREVPGNCKSLSSNEMQPSVETPMHAVLPHRVVVHVHSVSTIAWAVRRDGPTQLAERLAGLHWYWIPYVPSGLPLAREVEQVLSGDPAADVFVLANHGLVVCGQDCVAAEALLYEVERRLATEPRRAPEPDLDLLGRVASGAEWRLPDVAALHALGTDAVSRNILSGGILYPCQAIFLGHGAFRIVEGSGVAVRENMTRAECAVLAGLMEVVQRIDASAPIRYLLEPELTAVLNEDAHHYRELVEMN